MSVKKNYQYKSILKDEISNFIEVRRLQGYKDGSKYPLESLDEFLVENNISDQNLSSSIVDKWIVETFGERTPKTINNAIGYYNSFAKYLHEHGIDVFVPEFTGGSSSYVPYVFSESEINSLFRVIDDGLNNTTQLTKIQFPLFVRLLYGCGLRLSEALNLRISDIDFEQGVIFIKSAKGNRDRIVPVHQTLKIILQQYCINFLKMSFSSDGLLFAGRFGQNRHNSKPRSVSWAEGLFKKALRASNIELLNDPNSSRDICLYCLRHTFAVNSFRIHERAGVDTYRSTPFLSLYMGHKNLMGTETYLHMTDENAEDVLTLTATYTENLFPGVPNEE